MVLEEVMLHCPMVSMFAGALLGDPEAPTQQDCNCDSASQPTGNERQGFLILILRAHQCEALFKTFYTNEPISSSQSNYYFHFQKRKLRHRKVV